MNIEFDAYKVKLNDVKPALDDLAASLNVEGLKNELERLNHIVVGIAVQIHRIVEIGDIQIEICAVEFLVDLLVEQTCHVFVHCIAPP